MRKEEVIEAIDKLINLERQKRSILIDFEDIIASYADNHPLSFSFEECDYTISLLENAKEEINKYWDEEHDYNGTEELDESIAENNPKAQEIRDTIYSMLMTHSDYFRKDLGGQFDCDDDIEYEINEITKRVKNGQNIQYVKQPTREFDEKLYSLVKDYINAGGRDDIIAQDGF